MRLIKVLNRIIAILSIVIIIITTSYIYQVSVQRKKFGNIMGYTIFKIATGSMEPTISIGDKVIVKLTNNIKIKDIIVYALEDTYICHRVEEIDKGEIICKGDNNNVEDNRISINNIIGKVIYII